MAQSFERRLQRSSGQRPGERVKRSQRRSIWLIYRNFRQRNRLVANVYLHAYAAKFPPLGSEHAQQIAASLSQDGSDCAGVGGKLQLAAPGIGNVNPRRKSPRQVPPYQDRQCLLAAATRFPFGEHRVGSNDAVEGFHSAIEHHSVRRRHVPFTDAERGGHTDMVRSAATGRCPEMRARRKDRCARPPRRWRATDGDGGVDRDFDGPASALRSPAERRPPESRLISAIGRLIPRRRALGKFGRCGGEAVLTPCFLRPRRYLQSL